MITIIVILFAIIGVVACILIGNIIFRMIVGLFTLTGILIVAIGLLANSIVIPTWLTIIVITAVIMVYRSTKNIPTK